MTVNQFGIFSFNHFSFLREGDAYADAERKDSIYISMSKHICYVLEINISKKDRQSLYPFLSPLV